MAQIGNNIIRCALLYDNLNFQFVQMSSGRQPELPRGAPIEFQFAVFKSLGDEVNDPELYDISTLVGLPQLRIRASTSAGSILLDDTVATSVEKDASLDLASWLDLSKQHFRFVFPDTATAITTGTQFIVVFDAAKHVFGRSFITVIEPGTGASASPSPSAAGYYTIPETNGILQDYLLKQLPIDQGIVFRAQNPVTGQVGRITLQPIWDDSGLRLVPIPEDITGQ